MGLFNNYMKPGKGVSKDEPEKKGFFLYWDILFHRLSKILGANTLLTLTSLLWIGILMFLFMQFILPIPVENLTNFLQNAEIDAENFETVSQGIVFSIYIMFAFVAFTLLGSGPVSASYAYIVKNFANREHAWIFSDGWDKFKENFKQAIIVCAIDFVALITVPVAIKFYYLSSISKGAFFTIPCYLLIVVSIVYIWMHFYIYQIMVTFKCTVKQLFKNAFIFAVAKLPMNIFLTAVSVIVVAAPFLTGLNPFFAIIISGVIGLCFSRFAIEFYASRCMKSAIKAGEKKSGVTITYTDEPVFDDNAAKNDAEEKE